MTDTDRGTQRDRDSAFYLFTQQNLPACKPVLTPEWVFMTFLFIGFIFIPVGLVTLRASHSDVYLSHLESIRFHISRMTQFPRIVLFLSRYVKSRSDKQLLHGQNQHGISSCQPVEVNNDRPIIPCGLIAWSLFNDTFTFIRNRAELKVNRKNIAWKSDREHKFGKNVYPFNFQNGTLIGGGKLNPRIPLSDQEDLIVWMRTSALPSFRKLYGRIEKDLDVDDVVVVHLMNNYNTYSFGGKKKLVLSTTSWLGGKNDFLGLAYVFIGSSSVTIAVVFTLLHLLSQRH
ncbi:putative ALA-interacting subunit 2 isoform X3 [Gossypium raimondii]|uniref:putative ALA-interacting subunit 2 isoform X3 n=1 Tax=Gossypium raimondii TaxID=29730 RepID=UPI00227A878E|nr:putative ALA-interacting subunit 2 isoform X3 [Gossypium raimondii]